MPNDPKAIPEHSLATLCETAAVHTVFIVEEPDGQYVILARAHNGDYTIARKRGGVRTFKSLDGAAQLLRRWGVSHPRLTLRLDDPDTAVDRGTD